MGGTYVESLEEKKLDRGNGRLYRPREWVRWPLATKRFSRLCLYGLLGWGGRRVLLSNQVLTVPGWWVSSRDMRQKSFFFLGLPLYDWLEVLQGESMEPGRQFLFYFRGQDSSFDYSHR